MSKIKITVLMAIYNCAPTLPEALDSLLNQTYSAWKCILCDDGSADDTYSVAEKYVNMHPEHFILIRNPENKGLNYSLNKCLEFADTEYVARMDGDDISLPTRFEKEIEFLDSNKDFAIVGTKMTLFDENGDFRQTNNVQIPSKEQVAIYSEICHATTMMRTSALKQVNGYSMSPKTLRVEDDDLWIKMYANGFYCYNIQEPLYKMRDDANAISRRKFKYRVNEFRVRWNGTKLLGLGFKYKIKCLRPILIGLLPKPIYTKLHKTKRN